MGGCSHASHRRTGDQEKSFLIAGTRWLRQVARASRIQRHTECSPVLLISCQKSVNIARTSPAGSKRNVMNRLVAACAAIVITLPLAAGAQAVPADYQQVLKDLGRPGD